MPIPESSVEAPRDADDTDRGAEQPRLTGAATLSRLPVAILSVTGLAFAAVLAVTAFLGFYVRPTSDDWCMAMKERDWGVGGIVHEYYFHLNGRIANAFMSGVVYMGGGWITKVFPALLYLGLAVGTAWLAHLLFRQAGGSSPVTVIAAVATGLGVSMITAWGAFKPYTVVYWAAGTISHTLPSVITVLAVAAALTFRGRVAVWAIVLFGVGFVDATLSETFVFTCGTVLVVLVAYHLLFGPRWQRTVQLSLAGLAGLAVGIVVLYMSPGAVARRNLLTGTSLSATASVRRAEQVYWTMIGDAFNSKIVVPAIALGVLLALLLPVVPLTRRAFGWTVASCVVLPFAMAFQVAVLLGMGYGKTGWAYVRVWQDFLVPATLAFVLGSYLVAGRLVGLVVPRLRLSPAAVALAALVPLGFVLWGVHSHVLTVRTVASEMVGRATAWDAQSARIRSQAAAGETLVTYQPLHIAGLAEPFTLRPWSRDQIGQCAATYYHVQRLLPPAAKRP